MIKKLIDKWISTFSTIITLIIICPLFVYFGIFNFIVIVAAVASIALAILLDILQQQQEDKFNDNLKAINEIIDRQIELKDEELRRTNKLSEDKNED